ncbi:NAD-dependent epimerase/dehydratase family protein, partial [bacterium]|nr:NAD-dependent epimerase/dehydratase family protein [bacterium]
SSVSCSVGDLTDASACRQAMDNVNVVIHVAGEKRATSSFWPVNVQGTKNLLDAAVTDGVERFVHVSSVGVIGADPLQSKVFGEDVPCMPRNEYERSKWEAENLVKQAASEGLPVTILRPANVFGDCDPERGLLSLIRSVLNGWFIYIGGRDAICNYVYVEDVAHACLALVENPRAIGGTYHLSDACTLGEFVDVLADELGVKRPSLKVPNSIARLLRAALRGARRLPWVSHSPAFDRLISLNNQASFATFGLADELGFHCPVGWREGLVRLVEWYRCQGEL